jgi:hypothetical protein
VIELVIEAWTCEIGILSKIKRPGALFNTDMKRCCRRKGVLWLPARRCSPSERWAERLFARGKGGSLWQ